MNGPAIVVAALLCAAVARAVQCTENLTAGDVHPPSLIIDSQTGFLSLDQLTLKVRVPDVVDRTYTEFRYGHGNDSACNASVAEGPTPEAGCDRSVLLHAIGFQTAVARCGVTLTSTAGHVDVYWGALTVSYVQLLRNVSGTGQDMSRLVSEDLPFEIQLDTAATAVPTNIVVYDPVHAHPVLTGIDVDVQPSAQLITLTLVVGVQHPFVVTYANVSGLPASLGTLAFVDQAALAPSSTHSWQQFRVSSTPSAGVTQYRDISLRLDMSVACSVTKRASTSDCPIVGAQAMWVQFQFSTQSFTPQLVDTAYVNATLATYDAAYATPQAAFFVGDAVHVVASFQAQQVSITDAALTGVTLGSVSVASTQAQAYGAGAMRFSFTLDSNEIVGMPAEGSVPLQVRAYFTVTYATSRRRATKSKTAMASALISVSHGSEGSASLASPWILSW
eukprot:m51a1_g9959 hypothetical protein (447) ;mRNA; f:58864-60204